LTERTAGTGNPVAHGKSREIDVAFALVPREDVEYGFAALYAPG
jgi:hypothetical protein